MLRCSHVLGKVDDISTAVQDFTDLGFTVAWGSAPGHAHNALIWFDSGPFIELFELPSAMRLLWPVMVAARGRTAADRIARWARAAPGWCDVALETESTDLTAARAALRSNGIVVSPVMRGKRTPPGGDPVRYQFLATRPARLPFVVSSYDPPQRPASTMHANGATHIDSVTLGVATADRAPYDRLIGPDPWLRPVPDGTGVRSVTIAGLAAPVSACGAEIVPAGQVPL